MLGKSIKGPFEALNFVTKEHSPFKTCFIQLSDKVDPVEVIEKINKVSHGKRKSVLNAYIPDEIPNIAIGTTRQQKRLGNAKGEPTIGHAVSLAHNEIMMELQYKYTGLYALSSKGSHSLLEAIGITIYDRLMQLLGNGDEEVPSAFQLTGRYRKAHPHFGDFQLILGTLHRLEDAAGVPRTQLLEPELTEVPKDITVVDNVPFTKAQEAITRYSEKILTKLEEHVGSYDLTVNPEDSPEEVARKKVQTQLAKMMPYIPTIMKQVVTCHFAEDNLDNKKNRCHKMRMYGEPYLPGKELTLPLMKRHWAQRVSRWKTMYNLLVFDIPLDFYAKIIALDGTSLGGSKIIIRSSNVPTYRVRLTKDQAMEHADIEDEEEVDYPME